MRNISLSLKNFLNYPASINDTRDMHLVSVFCLRFFVFRRFVVVWKMSLCELLRKFIIVSCNLNAKLVAADYLRDLSDNEENNYKIFERFSRGCSSTLLCIMHSLGHCGNDQRLVEIISRHLEVRQCFDHEEDDAGGYIASFLRRIQNGRERGKKN